MSREATKRAWAVRTAGGGLSFSTAANVCWAWVATSLMWLVMVVGDRVRAWLRTLARSSPSWLDAWTAGRA